MIKWIRNRRRSRFLSEDSSLSDAAKRLNALYDEQFNGSQGLRRMSASWDISGEPENRQLSGSLNDLVRLEKQLSDGELNSCGQSTEASGEAAADSWLEFPFQHLIIGQTLHEGAFTQVLKGEAEGLSQAGDHVVIVKTLKDGAGRHYNKFLKAELEMMKDVGSHPNIVALLGVCTQRHPFCLLLEYLPHGSLLGYLRGSRGIAQHPEDMQDPLDNQQLFSIAIQACKGMAYLEGADIVHRDVAARNVFIGDNLVAKIGNFEHCIEGQLCPQSQTNELKYTLNRRRCVREKWFAMETLSSNTWSTATDVWSFGVLLWEIITLGGSPYMGIVAEEMLTYLKSGKRTPKPMHCSEQLYAIMMNCWEAMPAWRPHFVQLVDSLQVLAEHPEQHIDMSSYQGELYINFDSEYHESQLL